MENEIAKPSNIKSCCVKLTKLTEEDLKKYNVSLSPINFPHKKCPLSLVECYQKINCLLEGRTFEDKGFRSFVISSELKNVDDISKCQEDLHRLLKTLIDEKLFEHYDGFGPNIMEEYSRTEEISRKEEISDDRNENFPSSVVSTSPIKLKGINAAISDILSSSVGIEEDLFHAIPNLSSDEMALLLTNVEDSPSSSIHEHTVSNDAVLDSAVKDNKTFSEQTYTTKQIEPASSSMVDDTHLANSLNPFPANSEGGNVYITHPSFLNKNEKDLSSDVLCASAVKDKKILSKQTYFPNEIQPANSSMFEDTNVIVKKIDPDLVILDGTFIFDIAHPSCLNKNRKGITSLSSVKNVFISAPATSSLELDVCLNNIVKTRQFREETGCDIMIKNPKVSPSVENAQGLFETATFKSPKPKILNQKEIIKRLKIIKLKTHEKSLGRKKNIKRKFTVDAEDDLRIAPVSSHKINSKGKEKQHNKKSRSAEKNRDIKEEFGIRECFVCLQKLTSEDIKTI